MHADRTMLFSTDYPHWDTDTPETAYRRLPEPMKQRIFYGNAAELYGLGTPAQV
jgi:predicted TIM-barrel fold metal-dependent hydrolase